ncbi:hypothetical protein EPO15_18610 [bacterium]|nr:MAG: hypothetical protein EPO15_18610 [bacterium]
MLLLAALLALGGPASAIGKRPADAPAPLDCRPLATAGCWFVPKLAPGGEPALLVYFRGFWRGHGDGRVPPGEREASARQALDFYGLEAAASGAGAVLLVTGSSDAEVTENEVTAVERELGVSFKKLYLAAHSGGYNGLLKSLPNLRQPSRIVMLDDFYFTEAASAKLVAERVDAGAECSGFYTAHNEDRWRRGFKERVRCAVEKRDDLGHEGGVNACLGPLLQGGTCP